MTMAMDLIRHIAGLYSGKAFKGDLTQIYITGNEIWMAQQILASQQVEGAQGERDEYAEFETWLDREKPAGCVGDMERGWMARAALAQPSPKCATCNDNGVIGGFVGADSGYQDDPCPDCAQPSPAPEVAGWRDLILAAHPGSDPRYWPDALLVQHMTAEIEDLRARNEWLEQVAVEAVETEKHALGLRDAAQARAAEVTAELAAAKAAHAKHEEAK
ncbi:MULTISPECIES: hypothetical protein [unclassified Pseudomonas]|uniref:hypothetical protein n=1 Tax=unclassified Pseudomonas TaxID=196821 RepID=UPI0002A2333B|nr:MULTISPECIES: hypothetical protein [unclassified Pseudomonas]MBB1606495.1 hypothetical protein [Pseudomonas sp. UMC76]MBB1640733.1 hypothetical protein [Pseudomonas sp. UME83]NTX88134.1 hypothetical protein [Pseudomonas sp. UMA643]NTY18707.1 hypothetical protein [Pseudomonas sp. UMC3103]NTY23989.1 hypothetical protein [Pseudomonas sp. UMA603]